MVKNNAPSCRVDVGLCDGPVDVITLDWPGECGAETVFVGRTRQETHPQFGQLQTLVYEVFEPMAMKLMEQMAHDAAQRYDCRAVRMVHTQGTVPPGSASVVIQVATPHRGEAFTACRYLIDRLKHELPIWKQEHWEKGKTFVKGCCAHHESDRHPMADKETT